MKIFRYSFIAMLVATIVVAVYRTWFLKGLLTAPDFSYIYPMQLADFTWFPYAWSNTFGNGLGGSTFNTLNVDTYLHVGVKFLLYTLHIPWNITYRMLFFWPFIIVSLISSYLLSFALFKNRGASILSSLIYTTNTYVLMLSGGGQIGLMMAYAVSPFVLYAFIISSQAALTISIFSLLLFDLRYSFLIALTLSLYVLFVTPKREWFKAIKFCGPPLLIALGLHSFWLIPALFAKGLSLPDGYGSVEWLQFLSWAEFSKAISLLHPNWPENIFGKTYFLKPEFIGLPIVAFYSLLFVGRGHNKLIVRQIYFFALLALISAFFAKGFNPPFPAVNKWFFETVPFLNGFRDPTKYYLLISIAYSILIPYSLSSMANGLQRYFQRKFHDGLFQGLLILFIAFWAITIYPVFKNVRTGTFSQTSIPSSYVKFSDMVYGNKTFGRTVVFPWKNRFVFQTQSHPAISASDLFGTTDLNQINKYVSSGALENIFRKNAVKYIVVPDDFTNEIFLTNRELDPSLKESLVKALDSVQSLKRLKNYDDLIVYEFLIETGDTFSVINNHAYELYVNHSDSPINYKTDITSSKRPLLVYFSQQYDPSWRMWDGEKIISSSRSAEGTNTFLLDSDITSQVVIYNINQQLLEIGYVCSAVMILVIFIWFWYMVMRKAKFKKWVFLWGTGVIVILFVLILPRQLITNVFVSKFSQLQQEFLQYKKTLLQKIYSKEGSYIFLNSMRCRYGYAFESTYLVSYKCFTNDDFIGLANQRCWIGAWSCHIVLGNLKSYMNVRKEQNTIGILGDSISVIYEKQNYTHLLSEWLGTRLKNSSVLGSTVSVVPLKDSALLRYSDFIKRNKPGIIVIFLGTNDVTAAISLDVFKESYTNLIKGIIRLSPNSKIITVGLLKRVDVDRQKIQSYNAVIRDIAVSHSALYVDSYNWLEPVDVPDGIHPSLGSQKILAERLYYSIHEVAEL